MGMSKVEEQILEEVKYYKDRYFTYDEPVPFCGLKLYPVKVRNYNEFLSSNACFVLNKNDDPDGVAMSHLDYLISKMQQQDEGKMWTFKFQRSLELVFNIENGLKCPKCGKIISYEDFVKKYETISKEATTEELTRCECGDHFKERIYYKKDKDTKKNSLWIDDTQISAKDFQRLRRIVMYQNLPDFKDDSWVHKSIRDDQAAKAEIMSKWHGTATLEKKIVCVSAQTNYKIDEIYDMSIRKFLMLLETVDDVISYTTERIGRMTGLVSFKNKEMDHWIYKKDEGMYGASVDADSFKNQISNANG